MPVSYTHLVWTRYYEEALNIKVNWVWSTNTEQYAQKVNIAITSDDIPDVMQVNASQLKMMYDLSLIHI